MSTHILTRTDAPTHSSRRRFSRAEDRAIAQLHAKGLAWKQIAHQLGRSTDAVWRRAVQLGLHEPESRRRLTDEERELIIALYLDGATCAQIAHEVGRPEGSISKLISRQGLANRLEASGPVARGVGNTRQCRRCQKFLVAFAFASEREGTCRECRNAMTRMRRASAARPAATSGSANRRPRRRKEEPLPRVRVASLSRVLENLMEQFNGSTATAAIEVGASERRIRDMVKIVRTGEASDETCSFDLADRICVTVGSHIDLSGAQMVRAGEIVED